MSHDTWLHRSVRASVRPLINTPVSPNHITTVRLGMGLLSAGLFAVGGTPWQYYAAAGFVLSMLLDRADGELARVSGKSSPWGHKYDLVSDALCNALTFVGIGIGLRNGAFGWMGLPMGVIAGVAVVCILWWITRIEALQGQRAAEINVTRHLDPDDAIVVIPVAAVFNGLEPLLAAAAIGAPAFAWLAYRYRWRGLLTQGAKSS